MSYIYRLAGENLEMAEAELNGFLESQEINEKAYRMESLAETKAEPRQLKRLALTHEISEKISEADKVENLDTPEVKDSFAVRAENISEREIDKEKIESEIGSAIENKNNNVDLEGPENIFKAYILDDKILLGKVIENIDRGLYRKRKNDKRPFSSPISLDPVLARVLVNLSGTKPGEKLIDPFCGTGGILIEAGLCGIGVFGRDINSEMVEGTETNLEEYGIITHNIKDKNITDINSREFDAIITDLPYGQASKETEDAIEAFLRVIENFEGKTVFMYNEASLEDYKADYSVYIHKNLTRYIFVI